MTNLSIRTEFPSSLPGDFAVLPSPSTFLSQSNLESVNHSSPGWDQYPLSATDYHQHFFALPPSADAHAESNQPSHSSPQGSQRSSFSDRSASPASSFPSTPTGSPIPQNLAIDLAGGEKQLTSAMTKSLDGSIAFEEFDNFLPPAINAPQFERAADFNDSDFPPPPPHHNYPRQPVAYSHASSYYSTPPQQQTQYVHQQGAQGGGGPLASDVVAQQFVARQHTSIPFPIAHANVAYAVSQSAPGPAAIETLHGTYYFVPKVNMALMPQAASSFVAHNEPVQLPSSPSGPAGFAPPPTFAGPASNQCSGWVQLPNGQTAGVAIAQASTPTANRSASGATATVVIGDQKIRLPVGQGKRGSTKRPAKKDQVKKFICPHPGCGRGFARNFNMQSHHKSHLGIREFTCPHCPKKFSRRHDRARHCSAVHDSRVDRDGNVSAARDYSASVSSASPSAFGEDYDDTFDQDKDSQLVDFAG